MKNANSDRKNIVGFLAVLALSAVTMLWLFWHYPVSTGIVTLIVLTGLGVSARLARQIEAADPKSDIEANHRI